MPLEQLTATEARVAGLVASGHNDRVISAELSLDGPAYEHHLAEIYRKLGIRSRTELTLLFGQDTHSRAAVRPTEATASTAQAGDIAESRSRKPRPPSQTPG